MLVFCWEFLPLFSRRIWTCAFVMFLHLFLVSDEAWPHEKSQTYHPFQHVDYLETHWSYCFFQCFVKLHGKTLRCWTVLYWGRFNDHLRVLVIYLLPSFIQRELNAGRLHVSKSVSISSKPSSFSAYDPFHLWYFIFIMTLCVLWHQ